jgi:hypothetical protein
MATGAGVPARVMQLVRRVGHEQAVKNLQEKMVKYGNFIGLVRNSQSHPAEH